MFKVHLRDGKTLTENKTDWKDIPHQDIRSLQIVKPQKIIDRQGNKRIINKTYTVSVDGRNVEFIQLKRAITGIGPHPTGVTERVIGFVIDGKYAVNLEIFERTDNVKLTLEKKEGGRWKRM